MRKSRFGEEQIIGVLKEVDSGLAVGEVCRKQVICDQTVSAGERGHHSCLFE
jgi:putative transposase